MDTGRHNKHSDSIDPPATQRPLEPDHPMELNGCAVPGDMTLMVRCLTEELLMSGIAIEQLRAMVRDPNFQAFSQARLILGDQELESIIEQTMQRVGTLRCSTWESSNNSAAADLTISASADMSEKKGS